MFVVGLQMLEFSRLEVPTLTLLWLNCILSIDVEHSANSVLSSLCDSHGFLRSTDLEASSTSH